MPIPGIWEILLIFGVVVLLFGAKKLPQLGGAIGESIKNFKKGVNDNDPKKIESGTEKSEEKTDPK